MKKKIEKKNDQPEMDGLDWFGNNKHAEITYQ